MNTLYMKARRRPGLYYFMNYIIESVNYGQAKKVHLFYDIWRLSLLLCYIIQVLSLKQIFKEELD